MFTRAVVVGACGEVGRLVSQSLGNSGIRVTGVDVRSETSAKFSVFFQESAAAPSAELLTHLARTEALFVCLPEGVGLASAPLMLSTLCDGALWVDTFSVKAPVAKLLETQRKRLQICSINPMFAPGLGWAGKPVAAVALTAGERVDFLQELLVSWGAKLEMLGVEEHDRATAALQVATHAAALAFGTALCELGYDTHAAVKLATPPHRLLVALLYRIVSQNPEVYWDIQRNHPAGAATRAALREGLRHLDENVARDDKAEFAKGFAAIREVLHAEDSIIGQWSLGAIEQVMRS